MMKLLTFDNLFPSLRYSRQNSQQNEDGCHVFPPKCTSTATTTTATIATTATTTTTAAAAATAAAATTISTTTCTQY